VYLILIGIRFVGISMSVSNGYVDMHCLMEGLVIGQVRPRQMSGSATLPGTFCWKQNPKDIPFRKTCWNAGRIFNVIELEGGRLRNTIGEVATSPKPTV